MYREYLEQSYTDFYKNHDLKDKLVFCSIVLEVKMYVVY